MHHQVVVDAEVVVGDDAVAGINAAGQAGVVAFQSQVMDGDVIGLDQDDIAAAGAQRAATAAAAIGVRDGRLNQRGSGSGAG